MPETGAHVDSHDADMVDDDGAPAAEEPLPFQAEQQAGAAAAAAAAAAEFVPPLMAKENGLADEFAYAKKIRTFLRGIFGADILEVKTFEDYIRVCISRQVPFRDELFLHLLDIDAAVKGGGGLGRTAGNKVLKLLRRLVSECGGDLKYQKQVPKSWETVQRWAKDNSTFFAKSKLSTYSQEHYLIRIAKFPQHWGVADKWRETDGPKPSGVVMRIRDPLDGIVSMLNDPGLMFGCADQVSFRYYDPRVVDVQDKEGDDNDDQEADEGGPEEAKAAEEDDDDAAGNGDERWQSDTFTTEWCRKVEERVHSRGVDKNGNVGIVVPVSAYSDKATTGWSNAVTSEPVMCTLGNFSDALQRRDCAKMVLGYIDSLGTSETLMLRHLTKVMKFSGTRAEAEIKEYKRQVMQMFYGIIEEHIHYGWVHGIKSPILGKPVDVPQGQDDKEDGCWTLYPCLMLIIGDDPAQNRTIGVYEGLPNHPCRCCTYRSGDLRPFTRDCGLWKLRSEMNIPSIVQTAVNGKKRKYAGEQPTVEEKEALATLKAMSVHAETNAFHREGSFGDVDGSDCYEMSPTDLMHLFNAGLKKTLLTWLLVIIATIAKADPQFKDADSIFDSRFVDYGELPKLMHVQKHVTYPKGIMDLIKGKSKKDRKADGGASFGGQFRSSEFTNALLLAYLAIGFDGTVLPNEANYQYRKGAHVVSCGNVAAKVMNAIAAILDTFFETKRDCWTASLSEELEEKCRATHAAMLIVWELKNAILGEAHADAADDDEEDAPVASPHDFRIRKLHTMGHLPHITILMGCLSKVDTSAWEKAHVYFTTGETSIQEDVTNFCGVNNILGFSFRSL